MDLKTYLADPARSQTEFARRLGVSQGLVWQWIDGRTRITAERAIQIERATDGVVSRQELRPDLYNLGAA